MITSPTRGGQTPQGGIDFSLYLITDRSQTNERALTDVVRAALQGGVKAVQLREGTLPDSELFELALSMRRVTNEFGAKLIINKRCDLCLSVGADGVQLGIEGVSVAEARSLYADKLLIGYSAHSVEEAYLSEKAGADFITIGPVYETPSKVKYGQPFGWTALKKACEKLSIPVFALGGINRSNLSEVMAAGVRGVALISAIISASNPEKETAFLLKTIEEHAINS